MTSFGAISLLVGVTILVPEAPHAAFKASLDIIVRVEHAITRRAVTDLEIDDDFIAAVHELMPTALPGLEPRTHARTQLRLARLGYQDGRALQDVDELILPGVGMPQGRYGSRSHASEVYSEIGQAEYVTELALDPARRPRSKRLRIVRRLGSGCDFGSNYGDRLHFVWHLGWWTALALGLYVLPEPIEDCLPPISLLIDGMGLLGIEGDRDRHAGLAFSELHPGHAIPERILDQAVGHVNNFESYFTKEKLVYPYRMMNWDEINQLC